MTTISLDIDDTISAHPNCFYKLSHDTYLKGGRVIINSSRPDESRCRQETELQLNGWGIKYDQLYLFRPLDEVERLCPHDHFNWHQKYLWQKIHHCRLAGATKHYDDDQEVIKLFQMYAPEITIIAITQDGYIF